MASYYALFIILFPLILFFLFYLKFNPTSISRANSKKKLRPPSPPLLPIIGNLHQLGPLLHQYYWQLSKKHGPVMLLKLGRIPTLVVSSSEAAKDVLKVHDLACCSRPLLKGAGRLTYNFLDVGFAPYGDHWRNMKKLIVLELFSAKRVQSFRFLREQEVGLLVNSISNTADLGLPVNLTDKLFSLMANITYRMSFGVDFRGTDFDRERFYEVVHEAEAVVGSFSKAELFPFVGWIFDRITGHYARTEKVFQELDSFFEFVIDDHLKPGRKKDHDDIIDVLLRVEKDQARLGEGAEFTRNNIKGVLLNLFLAGIDTSAITLSWAMAKLVKNPRVMAKAQSEVRNRIGNKGKVTENDLDKLEYLKMVIKETFRIHPAAPLLLARETMSHCKINSYDIDPKTVIQVNAWAIGRDPEIWKNPEEFYPERFADSSIDYKGQHFELLPFGAGRRICPGIHMATVTIENTLANLLYSFDWKMPEGMTKEDMNMEEKAGVSATITKKTPLILVPVKRQ